MPKRVLVVCTGNTCRSVMAQGLLQEQLSRSADRLKEPIEVTSAGVFAIEGMLPSRETLRLLQQEGIDLSGHRARRLTDDMIRQADLILAMDQHHVEEVLRQVPDAKPKLHLLKPFGLANPHEAGDLNVPDPIGKPLEVYEVCFAMIREAVARVTQALASSQT